MLVDQCSQSWLMLDLFRELLKLTMSLLCPGHSSIASVAGTQPSVILKVLGVIPTGNQKCELLGKILQWSHPKETDTLMFHSVKECSVPMFI